MASNDTSASGNVTFQGGDDLSETNLSEAAAKSNQTDYVERGLGFANISSGSVTVGAGLAVIEDNNQAYEVKPNQTDVSLPESNGVNHIYLVHDPSVDNDISYHADTDDSGPTNPSLKIGTVDTSTTSSTTTNRAPDGEFESISTEEAYVGNTVMTPDSFTISDDSVATFDLSLDTVVFVIGTGEGNAGMFISSFGDLQTAVSEGISNEGNTDLTGTTGPDGSLNFSRVGNDGHLENRTGQKDTFHVLTFSP